MRSLLQARPDHVQPVELAKAYRLMNHGPTVLVSSSHAGRSNVMAAAWSMPLDFNPPKVCVVIDKSTLTRRLVEASGQFTLAVPSRAAAAATLAVGRTSGSDLPIGEDKFEHYGLSFHAGHLGAPLPADCLAWLECEVIDEQHNQQVYDLFIGEVKHAWADTRVFRDGHWHAGGESLQSIHYIAGGSFFAASESFVTEPLKPCAPFSQSD
ncbi:flavin reductase [beta proteobacterium AAP99]|nr:flavin reductase [beta proteobacterium AAP99]